MNAEVIHLQIIFDNYTLNGAFLDEDDGKKWVCCTLRRLLDEHPILRSSLIQVRRT